MITAGVAVAFASMTTTVEIDLWTRPNVGMLSVRPVERVAWQIEERQVEGEGVRCAVRGFYV